MKGMAQMSFNECNAPVEGSVAVFGGNVLSAFSQALLSVRSLCVAHVSPSIFSK